MLRRIATSLLAERPGAPGHSSRATREIASPGFPGSAANSENVGLRERSGGARRLLRANFAADATPGRRCTTSAGTDLRLIPVAMVSSACSSPPGSTRGDHNHWVPFSPVGDPLDLRPPRPRPCSSRPNQARRQPPRHRPLVRSGCHHPEAPGHHQRSRAPGGSGHTAARRPGLGDTPGDTTVSPPWGRPRRKAESGASRNPDTRNTLRVSLPARTAPICRHFRCRRRDSNPRHADYDSAALTD